MHNNHPCAKCGYCPTCGRSNQSVYPPYSPYRPYYPSFWNTVYGSGGTSNMQSQTVSDSTTSTCKHQGDN